MSEWTLMEWRPLKMKDCSQGGTTPVVAAPLHVKGHTTLTAGMLAHRSNHCLYRQSVSGAPSLGNDAPAVAWRPTTSRRLRTCKLQPTATVCNLQVTKRDDRTRTLVQQTDNRAAEKCATCVEAERRCRELELREMVHKEHMARLLLLNRELNCRLALAFTAKLGTAPCAPTQAARGFQPTLQQVASSSLQSPVAAAQAGLTAARPRRAKTAGGRRRPRSRQLSLPEAPLPFSGDSSSSLALPLQPSGQPALLSGRPPTGHVRDSELLRALQAAERRVASLEAALAGREALGGMPSLPDFDPLLPNIMVTPDDESDDSTGAGGAPSTDS